MISYGLLRNPYNIKISALLKILFLSLDFVDHKNTLIVRSKLIRPKKEPNILITAIRQKDKKLSANILFNENHENHLHWGPEDFLRQPLEMLLRPLKNYRLHYNVNVKQNLFLFDEHLATTKITKY